jgi:transcriptional regulator with XRE-family HTH domain
MFDFKSVFKFPFSLNLFSEPFNVQLKTFRKRLNFSQSKLGTTYGVKASSVKSWERGISVPSEEHFNGISSNLSLSKKEYQRFKSAWEKAFKKNKKQ